MKARHLGLVAYEPTWRAMQAFNAARTAESEDQLWLLEHPPVYTLGLAGRAEHVLAPGAVPVVKTDRGGQVTYHGPGQAIAYVLLDLKRARLGVRELVRRLEGSVVEVLANHGVEGARREGMPGVYVGAAKIAAVGLRIARGCSYHGLALNSNLELSPFSRIDPCGYPGLAATSLETQGVRVKISALQQELAAALQRHLAP